MQEDSRPHTSCVHPCDPTRKLWFFADVPHLLKNLRNHLTKGQLIYLPGDVVKKNGLPTNVVNLEYIKILVQRDAKSELKLAPHLNPACVDPTHYDKMKVSLAYSLFHNDTSAGLHVLVEKGLLSKNALSTAWFVATVFRWFRLLTSRTSKLAFSNADGGAYEDGVSFLNETVKLFSKISIGAQTKAVWKPVQTGIILSTLSALEVQDTLLKKCDFEYVLLSRFSQDGLENLFSTLRAKNPIPRLYEFKCSLRSATLAQFLRPSRYGSYSDDEGFLLIGLNAEKEQTEEGSIIAPSDLLDLSSEGEESLVYLAGYVISKITKKLHCEDCSASLTSNDASCRLIQLKNYSSSHLSLTSPSAGVVEVIKVAENFFRANSEALLSNRVSTFDAERPILQSIVPEIVRMFLRVRMQIFVRTEASVRALTVTSSKCGSKSVGMHAAVSGIR
nr:uncharacterized protein LOC126523702 [Dermacentor andersoni]